MNATAETEDVYCLRPGEAEALLTGAPWRRLLVMGDSIVVHAGDPVGGYLARTWVQRLRAALAPADFHNLGVPGTRATEIRARQLDLAVAFRPDLAVVAAGANDAARRSFEPATVESELDRMVGALAGVGALVVTLGCFDLGGAAYRPSEQRPGLSRRVRALGVLTERVCRRHGGLHVDFADHPAQRAGVLGADRLHIDARGHAVVAAELIRALSRRLPGPVSAT